VALRERIAAKRLEIADVESQLVGLQRTLVPPERMASVLQQLIGEDRRVRIVGLVNLPPTPLVQKGNELAPAVGAANATPSVAPAAPAPQSARHVFKHGVQVRVEGSYLDVLAYVAQIEKQPWQVYWGRTEMSADYPQVQVELTLYTLSLDKAWLVV
jgi:MSHA biogenesis protein MshJ